MQEPDASKDDTICKQVNEIINFDETTVPAPTPSNTMGLQANILGATIG